MISDVKIPLTKVFKPTFEEFQDFEKFVEKLDKDRVSQKYGVVKVIPPAKWKGRKAPVPQEFENITVRTPIEQNVQGKSGVYELLLIPKKSMKLLDYKKKVETFDALTDNKDMEEVEEMFWKNINFSPPLYGADMKGSLFDHNVPWNLDELPGVLSEGLKDPIMGINNSYLYIGSWKTMFGWHKEDLDLYSINYLHYGRPKYWYSIPPTEEKKLEDFARNYFAEGFNKCPEFLRHKTTMMHPYLLKQKIPDLVIHKTTQKPGEFIITFGGGYHAGFNSGFNIAEAVNYATVRWLEIFPHVSACKCINDSVKMEKVKFYNNILNSKKYGKIPHIKKLCLEHGKEEEIKSEEIEDEEDTKIKAINKFKNTKGKATKMSEKLVKAVKAKTAKTSKTKKAVKQSKEEDASESKARIGLSKNSKKIKKTTESEDDWRKVKTTRSGREVHAPNKNIYPDREEIDAKLYKKI